MDPHKLSVDHAQSKPPRLSYFISRSNGVLVPLIPADELPFTIRLQGVSRVLRIDQTVGMHHAGAAQYTGMTFKLEAGSMFPRHSAGQQARQPETGLPSDLRSQSGTPTPNKQWSAPKGLARQALAQRSLTPNSTATQSAAIAAHEASTSWRSVPTSETIDKTQAMIRAITSSGAGTMDAVRVGDQPEPTPTPPSGVLPDQDKKKFCTYWIRRGECDYMQQGCMYKHEMPDRATLQEIGINSVPRWWLEKSRKIDLARGSDEGKASVGPIVEGSVWLSKNMNDDRSSDGDDESAVSDSDDGSDGVIDGKLTEELAAFRQEPKSAEKDGPAEGDEMEAATKTTSGSNDRTPSPALLASRKASTTSDLIDFDSLIPSSSSATPALTPSTSGSSSPDHHEAEARKRAYAGLQRTSQGVPTSAINAVHSRGKQSREAPKTKAEKVGLMANRHAPHSGNEKFSTRGHNAQNRTRRAATSHNPASTAKEGAGQKQALGDGGRYLAKAVRRPYQGVLAQC